jgi:hypothetical protein
MEQPSERRPSPPLSWRRMLAINLAVALAVTLVFLSFHPRMSARDLLVAFAACALFTNAFGLPVGWLLARLAPLLDRLPPRRRWLVVTLEIVAFTVLGTLIAQVLMRALDLARAETLWADFWAGVPFSLVVALTVGLGVFGWSSLRDQLERTRRELVRRGLAEANAQKLLAEARLAALEARVQPHFLFNTLNSIAALIPEDPRLAEETVQRLAALLRFSLDVSAERLVPLARELKVVRDYLEIERARFGGRLRTEVLVAPETDALLVPPLTVQTLVENAVKHAVAARRDGAEIRLCASRTADTLSVLVADDGPGFDARDIRAGRGLDTLRERLQALFGERASLVVRRGDSGGAEVRLLLPAATGEGDDS